MARRPRRLPIGQISRKEFFDRESEHGSASAVFALQDRMGFQVTVGAPENGDPQDLSVAVYTERVRRGYITENGNRVFEERHRLEGNAPNINELNAAYHGLLEEAFKPIPKYDLLMVTGKRQTLRIFQVVP